jgi:hypothetical protein
LTGKGTVDTIAPRAAGKRLNQAFSYQSHVHCFQRNILMFRRRTVKLTSMKENGGLSRREELNETALVRTIAPFEERQNIECI